MPGGSDTTKQDHQNGTEGELTRDVFFALYCLKMASSRIQRNQRD